MCFFCDPDESACYSWKNDYFCLTILELLLYCQKNITIMKKIFALVFATGCFIAMISCSKSDKLGDWDDNIELSTKSLEFDASADSAIVTTKGTGWWITDVSVLSGDEELTYYFDEYSTKMNNYTIQLNCFKISRRGPDAIYIELNDNLTGAERIVTVGFEAGDYFDSVVVTQKAE